MAAGGGGHGDPPGGRARERYEPAGALLVGKHLGDDGDTESVPDEVEQVEEYWQVLLDLKAQGKVRAVGLSNHDAKQLAAAEALGHVDSLQPPFSLINRDVADEIAWCVAHDTGVIVYSPMQSGLLTGAFTAERAAALPAGDWRSRDAEFTGGRLQRNLALVEALRPIADRHATNVATIAVA
jgi:aryl-alcohol dehydrogenase-like predicted oxidoreductase